MRPIYIFLLLFLIISCKQEFELKKPNPDLMLKMQKKDNNALDLFYHYMVINYDSVSNKMDVKKLEVRDYRICSFSQKFDYNIEFSTESCEVSGGLKMLIKFPKVTKDQIIEWIELINASMLSEIQYYWNIEKTEYKPDDDQTGCYYELQEDDNQWNIIIWCGT